MIPGPGMCGFTSRLCRVWVSGYVTSSVSLSGFSSISPELARRKYPGGAETAIRIHPCEVGRLKAMSLPPGCEPQAESWSPYTPAETVAGEGVGSPVTVMKSQPLYFRGPEFGPASGLRDLPNLGLPGHRWPSGTWACALYPGGARPRVRGLLFAFVLLDDGRKP